MHVRHLGGTPVLIGLIFAAITSITSSCGYVGIGVGTAAVVVDSGGSGGRVDVASDVSASIVTPLARGPGGTQTIRVSLADRESRSLPIRIGYRTGGAGAFSAAGLTAVRTAAGAAIAQGAAAPFRETGALPASPSGTAYEVDWSFAADLGSPAARTGVDLQLELLPVAGFAGGVAFSLPGQKIGNDPPEARSATLIGDSGAVLIAYELRDSTADRCRVDAFFRVDGGPRIALGAIDAAEVTDLATTAAFTERTLIWDTAGEAALQSRQASVVIEIVPVDDALLAGAPATATAVVVRNGGAAAARITGVPARAVTGTARIDFTLADPDGDAVDVTPGWAIVGGPAGPGGAVAGTAQSAAADPTAGLATSASGRPHSFTWNYATDLGGSAPRRIVFTIAPAGGTGAAISPSFLVGNDAPAVAFGAGLAATGSGDVAVPFTLADGTGDAASVRLLYKTGSGSFLPATVSGTTVALSSAVPPAAPAPHAITWRSAADLPLASAAAVTLRLETEDGLPDGAGGFAEAAISITNAGAAAPPAIASITPAAGRLAGGTPVTILGQRFAPGAGATTATIGGAAVTGIQVSADGGVLTGLTPAGVAGARDVIVLTSAGSATLTAGYVYQDAPLITSVEPAEAALGAAIPVTIRGSNFVAGATSATVGTAAVSGVSVPDPTRLTGTAPAAAAAGLVSVSVTTPDGTAVLPSAFRYLAAPSFATIAPAAGPVAGGTRVTITGSGFAAAAITVTAGTAPLSDVVVISDGELAGTMPAGAAGGVRVEVTTRGGSAGRNDAFRYVAAPAIAGIAPVFGGAGGGTLITVTGTGFVSGPGATEVLVGGVSCAASVPDPGELTITAPPLAPGLHDVVVRTVGGEARLAGAYRAVGALSVASISPSGGSTSGGTPVVILGTGFIPGNVTVTVGTTPFDAVPLSAAVATGDGLIAGVMPAHGAGAVSIFVVTPFDGAALVLGYVYREPPTIALVAPREGPVAGGSSIGITGTGFDPTPGGTTITLGGAPLGNLAVGATTTAVGQTPGAAAPGLATLVVRTAAGEASLPGAYRYLAQPALAGISPAAGPSAGGTPVTVTGTGFVAGSLVVLLGGAPLENVTVLDDGRLTGTTPATPTAGPVDVFVLTLGGSATRTAAFTYSDPPMITMITPNTDDAAGGASITITGQAFVPGATTATLGGLPLEGPVTVSATAITGRAPPGPGGASVDLVVTTPGGSDTRALAFSYTGVTTGGSGVSIAPAVGSPDGGTLVTIGGSGFDGTTTVTIGGAALLAPNVLSASTIIGTTPPGRAGPAAVTVTTGAIVGTTVFTYAPAVSFDVPESAALENGAAIPLVVRLGGGTEPLGATVTVSVTLATGGSALPGDYQLTGGALTFPAGSLPGSTRQATLAPVDDFSTEDDYDTVELVLSAPSGGAIVEPFARHRVRLVDDDVYIVTVTAAPERPFVGESIQLDAITDVPAGSGRLFLRQSGGAETQVALPVTRTPFPTAPADADPRTVFKLRATCEGESRELPRLTRAFSAIGNNTTTGLTLRGIAAHPDGGAVVVGDFTLTLTVPGTATTLTSAGSTDVFVARFKADGTLVWVKKFGNATEDDGFAVTVAANGDAIVTGAFFNTLTMGSFTLTATTRTDSFVARLASADGSVIWAKDTRPANTSTFEFTDSANAAAAMNDGSVVIGGRIFVASSVTGSTAASAGLAFGAGEPFGVTLTGGVNTLDLYVARYSGDGRVIWAKAAGGTGSTTTSLLGGAVQRLAAFPDGSVVAAGTFSDSVVFGRNEPGVTTLAGTSGIDSVFLARYRADGSLAWARCVTSTAGVTVKGLAALPDGGVALLGGAPGNNSLLFGPGVSVTQGGSDVIARYAPDGTALWATRISGVGFGDLAAITAGPDGSIVYGRPSGGLFDPDGPAPISISGAGVVARFAPDGTFLSARAGVTNGTAFDPIVALAPLPGGRFVAAGKLAAPSITLGPREEHETLLTRSATVDHYIAYFEPQTYGLVEVRPQGVAWGKTTSGPAGTAVDIADVAVFPDGSTVAVGSFSGGAAVDLFGTSKTPQSTDVVVVRANADGSIKWVRAGTGSGSGDAYAVAALADGSAVVVGDFTGTIVFDSPVAPAGTGAKVSMLVNPDQGVTDAFAVRYDADGNVVWARRGASTLADSAYGVAAHPDQSVVVVGRTFGTASFQGVSGDFTPTTNLAGPGAFVVRYRADGTLASQGLATGSGAYAQDVAVLPSGTAIVVGAASGSVTFPTASSSIPLADTGRAQDWVAFVPYQLTSSTFTFSAARAIALSGGTGTADPASVVPAPDGGVWVAGNFAGAAGGVTADFGAGVSASCATTATALFVARYDPGGVPLFVRTAESTAGAFYDASPMPDGGVLAGGFFTGTITLGAGGPTLTAGAESGFVVRYRSDGTVAFARTVNGPGPGRVRGVAAHPDGGFRVGALSGAHDAFLSRNFGYPEGQ